MENMMSNYNLEPCFYLEERCYMKRNIFEDAKKEAGCNYISDLKYLDKWIVSVFKKMNWKEYDAEDIKLLMCYLYGK